MDAIIVAIAHNEYSELNLEDIRALYSINKLCTITGEVVEGANINIVDCKLVLVDVKGIFNRKEAESKNYLYWRL